MFAESDDCRMQLDKRDGMLIWKQWLSSAVVAALQADQTIIDLRARLEDHNLSCMRILLTPEVTHKRTISILFIIKPRQDGASAHCAGECYTQKPDTEKRKKERKFVYRRQRYVRWYYNYSDTKTHGAAHFHVASVSVHCYAGGVRFCISWFPCQWEFRGVALHSVFPKRCGCSCAQLPAELG